MSEDASIFWPQIADAVRSITGSIDEPWEAMLFATLAVHTHAELAFRHDILRNRLREECESPIERMFGAAWVSFAAWYWPQPRVLGERRPDGDVSAELGRLLQIYRSGIMEDQPIFVLVPQVPIGQHRADFVAVTSSTELYTRGVMTAAVVECDGHDFHERTKEQAARDKARDRALLAAGYPVIRFTGSELYRDPRACVTETTAVLQRALDAAAGGQAP